MKKLLATVLILLPLFSFAQKDGQPLIDSLLTVLPKAQEDTNKVKMLDELSLTYSDLHNPGEGMKYAQQELALATRLAWKKGIGLGDKSVGVNYSKEKEYTNALIYYSKAEQDFEAIGNKSKAADVVIHMGHVYNDQKDYAKALAYYNKGMDEFRDAGDKEGIAAGMINIGIMYERQNNFLYALDYYSKAQKIYEDIGYKKGLAYVLISIGVVYHKQAKYPNALDNYFKAEKIYEEIGNQDEIADNLFKISQLYTAEEDFQKAIDYAARALAIYRKNNEQESVGQMLNIEGAAYQNIKDYAGSERALTEALNIFTELKNEQGVGLTIANLAEMYNTKGDYSKALQFGFKALKMAEKLGKKDWIAAEKGDIGVNYLAVAKDGKIKPDSFIAASKTVNLNKAITFLSESIVGCTETGDISNVIGADKSISEAYALAGDYKKAWESHQQYTSLKDSVFSTENKQQLVKLDMQHNFDKQLLSDSLKIVAGDKIAAIKLQRQRGYTFAGVAGILALMGFSFFIFKERKKSDNLLLNILPSEVAAELKNSGSAAAKHFDSVTVLFTDFVGFTTVSERLTPQQLVDELHACFMAFDHIMAKYGIEKIKTVGDAYLAVSGLPVAVPQHAVQVVNAALEIRDFMLKRRAEMGEGSFEIRIGIHSGSVVAGIVGIKKFAYDIWGDTVNVAARMEQNSEAGKINISQTTYELVKDKFVCAYRGQIPAKNKGDMSMYFVTGKEG